MTTDREFNDGNDVCKLPFPYKLYQMLTDADEKGFHHIVSWNATGTSFKVHDSVAFTKTIIPKYFKQTRYKSFQVSHTGRWLVQERLYPNLSLDHGGVRLLKNIEACSNKLRFEFLFVLASTVSLRI